MNQWHRISGPGPPGLDEDKTGVLPQWMDRDHPLGTWGQSFLSSPINLTTYYTSTSHAGIPGTVFLATP